MLFFTKGYDQSLEQAINGAIFDEDHDESKLIRSFLLPSKLKLEFDDTVARKLIK